MGSLITFVTNLAEVWGTQLLSKTMNFFYKIKQPPRNSKLGFLYCINAYFAATLYSYISNVRVASQKCLPNKLFLHQLGHGYWCQPFLNWQTPIPLSNLKQQLQHRQSCHPLPRHSVVSRSFGLGFANGWYLTWCPVGLRTQKISEDGSG